jgi:NarL family two-component system response regulator LiaR
MKSEGTIRVLLVDDHEMVRSGLEVFLEAFDDLELVGEASNGEEAIQRCAELQPDVVLMDLVMPVMGGIEATRAIRAAHPQIHIVALTSFNEEDLVQGALSAGAVGYLLKNTSIDQLSDAIHAAYQGESRLSPETTQVLIKATTAPPPLGHDLTEREIEVLALMVEGLSNPDIGERLYISRSTVKNHVSNILSKLVASSRSEAVAMAVQHGLVDTDSD